MLNPDFDPLTYAAHVRLTRDKFLAPRPIPLAQVKASPEEAANENNGGETIDRDVWFLSSSEFTPATLDTPRKSTRRIKLDICLRYGVTVAMLDGPSRSQKVTRARQAAMIAIHRSYPSWSLRKVGNLFGGRDHSSVLYALGKEGAARNDCD